jgi:3-methyladenine DNA glycosylase/8-oxoguanine DNA glycosylase
VLRVRGRLVERLLYIDDRPVIVRAWDEGADINLVADAVDPRLVADAGRLPSAFGASPRPAQEGGDRRRARRPAGPATEPGVGNPDPERPASRAHLERAIARMRFAFGIDDDLRPFYERFRDDPLLGPAIRHQPWGRPGRRPDPWEVLAWAVTEQLIEAPRAHAIQRRIVRRWGKSLDLQANVLRAPPGPELIAGRAPAELTAMDLAPSRAVSMVRAAREVAAGRADLSDPASDRRLLAIPGIGPWTVALVGLAGRGDPDALPAGDLAYIKVIGRLANLGRRATVPEVEEFFRPYAPYRGLAGTFVLREHHKLVAAGPPLRIAA